MEDYAIWWILAAAAIAAEVMTGTLYLLMLGAGFAAAAVAAHFGAGLAVQIAVGALVGGLTTGLWHWHRKGLPKPAAAEANRDVNLDVGELVRIESWGQDGAAVTRYRGTQWQVQAGPGLKLEPGQFRVQSISGNRLIVVLP